MTRRDWLAVVLFVLALTAAVVTVAIVLHNRSGHASSAPLDKRQIRFCYPNQGTGGC